MNYKAYNGYGMPDFVIDKVIDQCNDFLNNHPEFKSVKALPHIERAIDEGDYLTLLPGKNNCDGFFIAVFEKEWFVWKKLI